MKLKTKITLGNLGGLSLFAIVFGVAAMVTINSTFNRAEDSLVTSLTAAKEDHIRDQVESASKAFRTVLEGPAENPREVVAGIGSKIRYADGNGYYFAFESDGQGGWKHAFHGLQPEIAGNTVDITKTDVNGYPFLKAMIEAGRAGGGFVRYQYKKPATNEIAENGFTPKASRSWTGSFAAASTSMISPQPSMTPQT